MQIQKGDTRLQIMAAARRLFAEHGFRATTTRQIAEASGTTLGNLYRYFPSKDALFCTLVGPVTAALEHLLDEHHGIRGKDVTRWTGEGYVESTVEEYMDVIVNHRTLLGILVQGAGGSSLERYKEQYIGRSTAMVTAWMARMRREHPDMCGEVSDFFVHLNNVWLFCLIEEVLRHNLSEQRTRRLLSDYVRFQIQGWKKMFKP